MCTIVLGNVHFHMRVYQYIVMFVATIDWYVDLHLSMQT